MQQLADSVINLGLCDNDGGGKGRGGRGRARKDVPLQEMLHKSWNGLVRQ